ncbi:hypothetical protein CPB85DRAFT_508426 [Mucidula mucida]|nr:hypothetical protein CPB85DRAFT_508426 [Mucidula mucida]
MPGFPKLPSIIFKRSPSEVPSAFDSGHCHPIPQYPQTLSRAPRSMSGFYSFSPDEKPFPEIEDGASQPFNQSLPDSWLLQADPRAGTQEENDDLNMRSHYAAPYSEGHWEMHVASTSYSAPQSTPSQHYAPQLHPYDTHEMAGYPAYSYPQQYHHSTLQTGMPSQTISPHPYTHSSPTTPSQMYATAQHSPHALPSVLNSPHATDSPYNQPSPMSASTPVRIQHTLSRAPKVFAF